MKSKSSQIECEQEFKCAMNSKSVHKKLSVEC